MKKILCSRCNKNNAEVFMTSIINGKKVEEILCLECALQKEEVGFMIKHDPQFQQIVEQAIKMKSMDGNRVINVGKAIEVNKTTNLELLEDCPVCGTDLEHIKKTGLAGCANCYNIFEKEMDRILNIKRITNAYKGRMPQHMVENKGQEATVSQLIILKQKLQDSINKEEYEQASLLKAQIVKLEKR